MLGTTVWGVHQLLIRTPEEQRKRDQILRLVERGEISINAAAKVSFPGLREGFRPKLLAMVVNPFHMAFFHCAEFLKCRVATSICDLPNTPILDRLKRCDRIEGLQLAFSFKPASTRR
jgi:hypothetical protein